MGVPSRTLSCVYRKSAAAKRRAKVLQHPGGDTTVEGGLVDDRHFHMVVTFSFVGLLPPYY